METSDPRSKRTLRRTSTNHQSMSDSDSTASQADSWHSPLRSESPFRSDEPEPENFGNKCSKSLTSFDRYYSPSPGPSPGKSNVLASSPATGKRSWRPWPKSEKQASESANIPSTVGNNGRREENRESVAVLGMNRLVKDEQMQIVKNVATVGGGGLEEGYGGTRDGEGTIVFKSSSEKTAVRRAALVFRVFEMAVCLISFSVMATDKTQGWSGDSFDRYIEYRYCLGVNIIGFIYSGLQAVVLICHMSMGKHVVSSHLRFHFDFSMDQILAYLVLSASCCAATRVTDWISNWGKDEFTLLASASIAMSFLAFVAFAFSSLISGYNLCTRYLS